jgi:hypothetical protein
MAGIAGEGRFTEAGELWGLAFAWAEVGLENV